MSNDDEAEERELRDVALHNVQSILQARRRAERELLEAKEALEEEKRVLEVLNRSGAALSSKLDLEAVVQSVTDAATELSGAQLGAFFYTVRGSDGAQITLSTLSGASRDAFEKLGSPRSRELFGPTFEGQAVIRIADLSKDPRYAAPEDLPVRSYLAVPVVSRSGDVIGGLFFGHPDPGIFTERAERLVVGIASQAAIAIDNARLYEEAKRSADAERVARATVERVSVMKDEFLATLSHELRTPLNAILGWSAILMRRVESDDEAKRAADTIQRNARAQAQLIEDLLDMNMIVSGKIRLDVQAVSPAAIVETAIDAVRPSVEAKDICIRKTVDPSAGPVQGDAHRLQQVVWNLLTNAAKFTPKHGKIDVLVRRVGSQVEIVVRDSGIGIRPEFLPHVFERFRQADASTTRRFGGLGLGLSIVKQLVELHGGTVGVSSSGEGHGATFTVSLPVRPLRDASSAVRGDASPGLADVSLDGIDVLVVDDAPDARELLVSALEEFGATARSAESAKEALALMQEAPPDVLVSDIGMPERDGYELMKDIRALSPSEGGRVPAIALTAFARTEDRTRAMLAGFQVHLSKPTVLSELFAAIKSLVSHSRGDR